jgi:hypothetical protein
MKENCVFTDKTSRRSRSHSESEGKAAIEFSKKGENNFYLLLDRQ